VLTRRTSVKTLPGPNGGEFRNQQGHEKTWDRVPTRKNDSGAHDAKKGRGRESDVSTDSKRRFDMRFTPSKNGGYAHLAGGLNGWKKKEQATSAGHHTGEPRAGAGPDPYSSDKN